MKGLMAEIAAKGYKIFKPAAEARVRNALFAAQQKLIDEFERHPVTEEISDGPSASNKTNTLGGHGNLFSFIGFDKDSDPISPIRSLLAKSIRIKSFRKKPGVLAYRLTFSVPTKDQIDSVSSMPWSTASWSDAIEKGISGIGQYLYSDSKNYTSSRSGPAVQLDFDLTGGTRSASTPIDYITGILERMLKDIESRLKRI